MKSDVGAHLGCALVMRRNNMELGAPEVRPYTNMVNEIIKNNRRSIRLAGYDYRAAGGYFVTICAAQRRPVFGDIKNGAIYLHQYGRIVEKCWQVLPDHFSHVTLDEFVVMPNHFHGILMFQYDTSSPIYDAPYHGTLSGLQKGALSTIISQFKMRVTQAINKSRMERGWPKVSIWQRNYYEHIIRNEAELNKIQRYIIENPVNWPDDEYHP